MIKFFRKIRYDLLEKNKTGKYLKYIVKICFVICFFHLQCLSVFAQEDQRITDSLVKIYQEDQLEGIEKLELLFNLSYNEVRNRELALKYAEELIALSKLEDNYLYLYRGYHQKGNLNRVAGDLTIALDAYSMSIEAAKKEENIAREGSANMAIADVYSEMGDSNTAQIYYDDAIQLLRKTDDPVSLGMALFNAGDDYLKNKKYGLALQNFEESIQLFKNADFLLGTGYNLGSIGLVYAEQGKNELALINIKEAIKILEDFQDINSIPEYLKKMNDVFSILVSQKQVEVDLLKQQKRNQKIIVIATIIALLFIIILAYVLYRRYHFIKETNIIIEEEKDRSENLLLNILPSEIAEELKLKGSADARNFDLVSIIFTDFKSFSKAAEKLTAKELIGEINHCFIAFDHICEKYRIEKIKTIGDAYMAAGGLPVPSDDAVNNVVLAALDMQSFIANRILEKQAKNEIPFKMRLGIHSGPVVAGIVGVKKFQYDIWGDTVNTASRLESSGEIGKVNISEDTYELIKDDPQFKFESRGKIQAKNKGEIEMYFVTKTL